MNTPDTFLEQLEATIQRHGMLNHPFYKTWTMGTLSKTALREYAKQYYHFVQAFPTFLSATHANTPSLAVRQELLENLIEEERGEGNHPGLWVKFAESLGMSTTEAVSAPMLPETREAIESLRALTRNGHYLEGVSALYAYESQIPEVARVKIEGLRTFYDINDPTALSFFTVHQEADVYHSAGERKILEEHALTATAQHAVLAAAESSARAMLRLLDGVYREYVQPSVN